LLLVVAVLVAQESILLQVQQLQVEQVQHQDKVQAVVVVGLQVMVLQDKLFLLGLAEQGVLAAAVLVEVLLVALVAQELFTFSTKR
jgi:hypothetical protein